MENVVGHCAACIEIPLLTQKTSWFLTAGGYPILLSQNGRVLLAAFMKRGSECKRYLLHEGRHGVGNLGQ